jgi:hypothetical protein
LFDGKALDGWRGYKRDDAADSRWKVVDGTLAIVKDNGRDTHGERDIISKDTFEQFELSWDWKVAPGGNSGLKYFILEDRDSAIGHEYQMIDDAQHPDAKIGPHRQTAAFYDVLPAADRPTRPAGEWNTVARRRARPDGRALVERQEGPAVRVEQPGAQRRDREEQVQGDRAVRQAAERPHPPAGSRRRGLVPQYQNPATRVKVGILGGGNISDTHARAARAIPGVENRRRLRREPRQSAAASSISTAACRYDDLDRVLQSSTARYRRDRQPVGTACGAGDRGDPARAARAVGEAARRHDRRRSTV